MIGSHARRDARADSDVDLLIVTTTPDAYVRDTAWTKTLGRADSIAVERWGAVTSLRVLFEGGPEVELGLTTPDWAKTDPVDAGTARVVRDGFRVLLDRDGLLLRLVEATTA